MNAILARLNIRIDSLTSTRRDASRINDAVARGDFEQPIYAVPDSFHEEHWRAVLLALPENEERFLSFRNPMQNEVGYEFSNGYYSSPDAEVLYTIVRTYRPARVLEIGCGNSTKIIRQAIRDGNLACHHRCIDPYPRQEISELADEVVRRKIETFDPAKLASQLGAGDILFIDTSHEVAPANDVAFIFGRLLPIVPTGVIVHIHDIFLPYEYPLRWVKDLGLNWGEQYIAHAMLTAGRDSWEVLWPGYYLQRTFSGFNDYFPAIAGGNAQSLWIRRRH